MSFGELLDEKLIKSQLKGGDKFAIIEELLDLIASAGKLRDKSLALQDCIKREKYLSTGLENGLAIPHAKTEATGELLMSFGISREGIEFDSLDGKPAHFIFLLLSPVNTSGPHIKVLSQITRLFRQKDITGRLLQAAGPEEILAILKSPI
ncbi:MAG: PTS sugar transporter subunit IIA [Calditrichia bacterium]